MKVVDICTCEYPVDLGDGRCRFCGGLIPRAEVKRETPKLYQLSLGFLLGNLFFALLVDRIPPVIWLGVGMLVAHVLHETLGGEQDGD